jgi:hypothetical protein
MSWQYRSCPRCNIVLQARRFWPVGWHCDWKRDLRHRGIRERRCPECGYLGPAGFFRQSKPPVEAPS